MLRLQIKKQRGAFALDVNISAPTPGVVALFGRSGCGKSTLVSLIAGLLSPDSGRIELNGELLFDNASNLSLPVEARRIGYVFQDARLFPHYTVLGNLQYGLKRASGTQLIGQEETIALLGLEALLARRPHELSGGEKQRVALGRALLSQPRLLLLDEPLASLDVARREEVLPYLERLRDRLAIPMVYVSHQFDEVLRLATHVVVLDNGRVAVEGDINEVSLSPALRSIVGPEAVGAVIDGKVLSLDVQNALADIAIGSGVLRVHADTQVGNRVRVQMLARDIILATQEPKGLSVRNSLAGIVGKIERDDVHSDLVYVNIGAAIVMARITRVATQALQLALGTKVWVLVKAVSMRGHAISP
ncbi:MAG: molybdenum ABC transporter ATP-binding protein [Candidatus Obscuribacterales bacterium]|nr:molybdenum ABC transporter ATP-binding protein [Steroidobacteraceae bacterium]